MVKTNSNIVAKDGSYITGSSQGLSVKSSFAQLITLPRIFVGEEVIPIPYNLPCVYFYVRALRENTVPIYVRGIGDDANSTAEQRGEIVYPGEKISILLSNTNLASLVAPGGNNEVALITVYPDQESVVQGIDYTEPVIPDTDPPGFVSIVPADTATGVSRDTDVTVTFDEDIDPDSIDSTNFAIAGSGLPTLSRFIDPTNPKKMIARPSGNYAALTVYTVTVSGIKDLAGNTQVGSSVTTFTTAAGVGADVTPPTISSKSPDSGVTNAERSVNIVIVFSEAINAADVENTTFTLTKTSGGANQTCTVTLGVDQQTVTMDPNTDLEYGTGYTVTVIGGSPNGVRDLAGNFLASTQTWNFQTRAATQNLIYNVANNGGTTQMGDAYNEYIGTEIATSSHPLHGHVANVVKARARKLNSPPGNVECWVLDEDFNELYQIGSGFIAANLTSSSGSSTEMTFTDNALSTPLEIGQFLVIKYALGDSTNRIRIMDNDSNVLANSYKIEIDLDDDLDRLSGEDWAAQVYENS